VDLYFCFPCKPSGRGKGKTLHFTESFYSNKQADMNTELFADYLVLYHLKLQHFSLDLFQYVIFNYFPEMAT
jgi:hypothetical protein